MCLQVCMSLVSAARRTSTLRSRQNTLGVASRSTFRAHPTRTTWCLNSSSNSVVNMPAYTSMSASVAWPDLFLLNSLCSPNGRGIPDISAQAYDFQIFLSGKIIHQDGTSCSAPVRLSLPSLSLIQLTANVQTVAGVISLLNDYQISRGEAALSFLNPWLYGQGLTGLNDITSGSNPGCGTEGFSAIVGWDPVRLARLASLSSSTIADLRHRSQLGTPDFLRHQENSKLPIGHNIVHCLNNYN